MTKRLFYTLLKYLVWLIFIFYVIGQYNQYNSEKFSLNKEITDRIVISIRGDEF